MIAADLTLDELRLVLAPHVATAAIFDGWSSRAVAEAASASGIDPDVAAYAFKGGAMEMIAAWIADVDDRMTEAFPPERLNAHKVRDRIRELVLFRLDAVTGSEEAVRRALSIMAMPQNAAGALRLGWNSADRMWRLAGDVSTDHNHYTKRAILAGVYAATLAVFVDDQSEGKLETRAFLDRRIDGIMRFERTKSRLLRPPEDRFRISRFLGRLRYPAR